MKDFWDKFKALCDINDVKPNTVCREIGLTNSSPTHWKRGLLPRGDSLLKIMKYFDVKADYFLDDDPITIEKHDKNKNIRNYKTYNENVVASDISKRIKRLLRENNRTYSSITSKFKVHDIFYNMEVKGHMPKVKTLLSLANYLDVSVDYLLGRTSVKSVIASNNEDNKITEELIECLKELSTEEKVLLLNNINNKKEN